MPTQPLDAGDKPRGEELLPDEGGLVGGRYRPIRVLGSGGMGTVWEVQDCELHTRVALKMVRGPAWAMRTLAQLKHEIQLARRVTHPNVCRTHDLGTHRGADGSQVRFLTMELVDGETLAQRIHREGTVRAQQGPADRDADRRRARCRARRRGRAS